MEDDAKGKRNTYLLARILARCACSPSDRWAPAGEEMGLGRLKADGDGAPFDEILDWLIEGTGGGGERDACANGLFDLYEV
jgi:hypothetical protein